MPHDWNGTRRRADYTIQKYGGAVTIRRNVQTGPAWDPTVTAQDTAAVAVIMEFERDATHFDGQPIEAGDKRALITALGLTITPDPTTDNLIHQGRNYRMVRVKPLQPADVVVFFEIQVRS